MKKLKYQFSDLYLHICGHIEEETKEVPLSKDQLKMIKIAIESHMGNCG
jgi:hypothetical protein